MIFILGLAALTPTFSRAGGIGLAVGILVFFAVGGWSRLIPRRVLILSISVLIVAGVFSLPFLLVYFGARPGSFWARFYMHQAALQGYLQHPLLGVGFNNSTAAMTEGRQELIDLGIKMSRTEPADSYYVAMLVEVGPIGCLLLFGFFGRIVMTALHAIKENVMDTRPLLVGIVAGLASLATQSISDIPTAGHAVNGSLWFLLALIVAIGRGSRGGMRAAGAGGCSRLPGGHE